jgi:hypothetical protein
MTTLIILILFDLFHGVGCVKAVLYFFGKALLYWGRLVYLGK